MTAYHAPTVKRLLVLVAAALGLGLVASACNPATPYAAIVNGQVISQSELNGQLAAIADNASDVASIEAASQSQGEAALQIRGPEPGTYNLRFATEALDQDIEFAIIQQQFDRRHLRLTAYELESARADLPSELGGQGAAPVDLDQFPRSYQNTLVTRQAEILALEAAIAHVQVSAAAVSAYFTAHAADMFEACASRILVTSLPAAAGVLKDLASGTSFAAEAAAKSQDTNTTSNGGQLGCGSGLQFAASFGTAFASAVATAPLDHPVGPVRETSGFDILEVTARQALTESEAAAQIRQELVAAGSNGLDALLGPALTHAQVSVASTYGTWSAGSAGSGIIPPPTPTVRSDSAGSTGTAGAAAP